MPKEELQKVKEAIAINEEPYDTNSGSTEKFIIEYLCEEYEMTESEAIDVLEQAYIEGHCYRPDGKRYRVVS